MRPARFLLQAKSGRFYPAMKCSALFPSEKGVPFSVRRKSGRQQLVSLPPAGRTFEAAVEVLREWATVRPAYAKRVIQHRPDGFQVGHAYVYGAGYRLMFVLHCALLCPIRSLATNFLPMNVAKQNLYIF
jgi:hypothetical protein